MRRFIEGENRQQVTLMPECLDDYIGEDNPVRVVDAFFEALDLYASGFEGVEPATTTLGPARSTVARSRSSRASSATWTHWRRPTERSVRRSKPSRYAAATSR